jgi:sulfide dehydrogenase cytochrome subunit
MKKKFMAILASTLMSGILSFAGLAADRGMILSLSCAGCHGTDGKGVSKMRPLYGKTADYIERNFKAMKSGEKDSTIMQRIGKGYTDEEIKLIAEYFAGLKK